jgi:DNA-binding CsgD family transcriptional regulator
MNGLAAQLEELGGADIAATLEQLLVPSFVLDRAGIIRWLNDAARAQRGDTSGRSWVEIVPKAQSREVADVLRQIICSGEPAELSIDLSEPDGRVMRQEISAAPLKDGNMVVGVFGVKTPVGARRPDPQRTSSHGLTERQLEVLQLLAEGKSTQQIADELVLSKTTVRNHIAHILANLGVHTRVQAVIAGSRTGLVHLPPPPDR